MHCNIVVLKYSFTSSQSVAGVALEFCRLLYTDSCKAILFFSDAAFIVGFVY